jgi:hypothetical protein
MFSKMLNPKKAKTRNYEVLFLGNDKEQDVEVHEVNQVDFLTVKERLERGESVFITSKSSQKLVPPKQKVKVRNPKTRFVTALNFDPL